VRTILAMICASIAAAAAMLVFSPTIADTVVASYRFESADSVGLLHTAVYITCNVLGLLIGYAVGFIAAGPGRGA
jgi:hypothetical protein